VPSLARNWPFKSAFDPEQITSGLNEDKNEDASSSEHEDGREHSDVSEGDDHLDVVIELLMFFKGYLVELLQNDKLVSFLDQRSDVFHSQKRLN
jgi:hypothetical protein